MGPAADYLSAATHPLHRSGSAVGVAALSRQRGRSSPASAGLSPAGQNVNRVLFRGTGRGEVYDGEAGSHV